MNYLKSFQFRINYYQKALALLLLEMVLLGLLFIGLVMGILLLNQHCWFGLFGGDNIEIVDRYYRVNNGVEQHITSGEERSLNRSETILLGIKPAFTQQCFCPNGTVYATVHNFTVNEFRQWIEVTFGGEDQQLSLVNEDNNVVLEGVWTRPPSERIRIEVAIQCSTRPNESHTFDFATFAIR